MSRKFVAFAVLLPLVVLALGIVRAERQLAGSRRWAFEIAGYDPRDLLRGRYLLFQLAPEDEQAEPCSEKSGEHCCLCLREDPGRKVARTSRMRCETAFAQCEGALDTRHLGELRRYYIAEENAGRAESLFRDAAREGRATLVVAIDRHGRPQIDGLFVDDVRIEDASRR